jgi:glutamyl-tRNA reductase
MSEPQLVAFVAAAPGVAAAERAACAARLEAWPGPGLLLVTCHRTELYTVDETPGDLPDSLPGAVVRLGGHEAVRHLVRVAIGVDSAVLAEDQVLHQLRAATAAARRRDRLPPTLDRLLDVALAAGRRARSWHPAGRRSLADRALAVAADRLGRAPRTVLVVGTGEMGRLAAKAARRAGLGVAIAGRTQATTAALAAQVGGHALPFDPGPVVGEADVVIVALRGPWLVSAGTAACLDRSDTAVVDLSAPPAVPPLPGRAAAGRLVRVDDLADSQTKDDAADARLRRRLEELADETVAAFDQWLDARGARTAAAALAARADERRRRELDRLWHRLPDLDPETRDAIEAMTTRLAQELLREPVAKLTGDRRHEPAARDLFGL